MSIASLLDRARAAKGSVAFAAGGRKKTGCWLAMAGELRRAQEEILTANGADLQAARGTISEVMLDRLRLTPERIEGMAAGLESVAALPDPVGQVKKHLQRPNGLVIEKVTAPWGSSPSSTSRAPTSPRTRRRSA